MDTPYCKKFIFELLIFYKLIELQIRRVEVISKTKSMNFLNFVSNSIIEKSFNTSVWIIRQFNDKKVLNKKLNELRCLPNGTLGKEIANCLDKNNLDLVAGYESHDLKHIVLGYKMTPLDEIRMQAFMLGNGNYTFPCIAILIFGMLLLPHKWLIFAKDFKRGRIVHPISSWTIEVYGEKQLIDVQKTITDNQVNRNTFSMPKIVRFSALLAMISGVFGMLFCLPYLFSSSLEDLVGAGFPFVGGAILAIG